MNLQMNIRSVCTLIVLVNVVSANVNVADLMKTYINVCGAGYTCYDWSATVRMPSDQRESKICPECSCEEDCFQKRTCCPDKYFTRPYSVYKSIIINYPAEFTKQKKVPQKYAVVNSCPDKSEPMHKHECENEVSPAAILASPPVTSTATNSSYFNRACAYCHGEKKEDLHDWQIIVDINCMFKGTIFYFSSYEEILSYAINASCALLYSPHHTLPAMPKKNYNQPIQDFCNVSGTWKEMDHNIQKACASSYDLYYRSYSNIFCAMCNPIYFEQNVSKMSSCNLTGEWFEYDEDLISSCRENPVVEITHPYKNVFCFLCNKRGIRNVTNDNHYVFNDATLRISETMFHSKKYVYEFDNIILRDESLFDDVSEHSEKTAAAEDYTPGILTSKNQQINITYLLMKRLSLFREPICDKSLLPLLARNQTDDNCQCDPLCILRDPCKCCLDTALSWPITCIEDRINLAYPMMMSVFNGCHRTDGRYDGSVYYGAIRHMCENSVGRYDMFPVVSAGSLSYRNIYCHLCNNNFKIINESLEILSTYTVWGMQLQCSKEMNLRYSTSITETISYALSQNLCTLLFNTGKSFECPKASILGHSQCNATFNLQEIDNDVQWACKKSHYSKYVNNDFCQHCNPRAPITEDPAVDTCDNTSLNYDPFYREACLLFPNAGFTYNHPSEPRYKNRFCESCNKPCAPSCLVQQRRRNSCQSDPGSSAIRPPLITNLFRFHGVASPSDVNERVDENDKSCYPGRTPAGDKCVLFFQVAAMTTYTLHFEVDVNITSTKSILISDLPTRLQSILFDIQRQLNPIFSNRIIEFFVLPLVESADLEQWYGNLHFKAVIYVKVQAIGMFNRSSAEDALYAFPSRFQYFMGEHVTNFQGNATTFINVHAIGTRHTPPYTKGEWDNSTLPYAEYIRSLNDSFLQTPLKNNHVSSLLFCKQNVYKKSDFIIDYNTLELVLKKSNQSFKMGHFINSLKETIHICEDDIPKEKVLSSTGDLPLRIVTLTCTGISLICLVLTFITYCLLKALRTLPGLNVMSLVFSLFCAQLLFIFSDNADDHIACKVVGILLHYFWLCACCCLLVCCFHMFKVFNARKMVRSGINFTSHTFYRYIMFSYLLPLAIVGTNVAVMFGVTKTLGYGQQICFVENLISNIISFIIPLIVTCCCNCFFFFKTVRGIAASSRIREDKVREAKTFAKLFSITGLVWIVQIIDAFVGWIVLSYLATVLVCLQGCFIFFSFCCSKTVKRLWKESSLSSSSKTNFFTISMEGRKRSSTKTTETDTDLPLNETTGK
ncbi:uncharacterized protein LOC125651235 [Ostrea edulis]|uniref:uncharacterized protein LOC125651235 n=1 Tax=Ostrea edulis TaxID=37623 RepID=UPI0024AED090|nr:uncharacterized protein LOC125651235 [Ostrea edulis]